MIADRSFLRWLGEGRVRLGDGAMGTMLQAAGLSAGTCPELWNVERPDAVEAVMRAYVGAGSEVLETNSFGGSPQKLEAYGLADRCEELNREAAVIGRRAAGSEVMVLGSMGPTGKLLQPLGPLTEQAALDGFRRQAEGLAEGGVDALCVETMTDLAEALLAVRAGLATGLPVLATMTFDATKRGFYTMMGVDLARAARAFEAAGVCAVGANCGTGPLTMIEMARAMAAVTPLPLMVQPNAGLPELIRGETRYSKTPADMASHVEALIEAGATLIGGCCGTTPEHLKAMGAEVRRLRRRG